jgi:hypothetical protein
MKFKTGRKNLRFLLFLILVHGIFFAIALIYKRIYMGDSFEYVYQALNIKDHFWFYSGNPALPAEAEYLTIRPPLYSICLMLVYLFTVNNWVVIFLQNLLSIFNILYLRDTIRKVGYKRRYDYILMAFVMLYPSQFINANTIAPDILLQTCVVFYFRYFILLITEKKWRHAYWMSLALITGFLVKPVLYPFTLVHCIIILLLAAYMRYGVKRSSLAAVLPVCVLLLCIGINLQRTGKAHYSSNQAFNAIYYYYFYFSDKEGVDKADVFLDAERSKIAAMPAFADRYDYANQRGMQLLKDNFVPYMGYHIKHSARLLIDPGKAEWDMFTGSLTLGRLYNSKAQTGFYATMKRDGIAGLGAYISRNPSFAPIMIVLFFNLLRLLGLLLFITNRRFSWRIRLFVFCFIGYFAITTGPIANPRYFIPVSLIAIGCATMGYQQLLSGRKNKAIIAGREGAGNSFA